MGSRHSHKHLPSPLYANLTKHRTIHWIHLLPRHIPKYRIQDEKLVRWSTASCAMALVCHTSYNSLNSPIATTYSQIPHTRWKTCQVVNCLMCYGTSLSDFYILFLVFLFFKSLNTTHLYKHLEKPASKSTLFSPLQQVLEGLFTNNQLKT
jgi:hypothetical protein